MEISALQAVLLGLYYWNANSNLGYGPTWARPLFAGMISGLVLGDIKMGCIIGAYIQPLFLAFTGAGGTVVWDACAGTVAATAIVMSSGIPAQQAATIANGIALPIAILFAQIHTIRRIWFAVPAQKADEAAAKGQDRKIVFYGSWFCWMSKFVLYGIPMTLAIMFGAEAIGTLMDTLPKAILNALSCAGGMLPALGFAMTIRVIGRPTLMPFFLGGFFLVQYAVGKDGKSVIPGLFLAMIGLFIAFIYYLILDAAKKDVVVDQDAEGTGTMEENTKRLLTLKDCDRVFRRWFWFAEQSNSFARLQSVSFCCAFIPALKKLYGNDPEEYSQALTRHLMFFNTQGIWGSVIHGIVLAMEEQRAMGAPITAEAIGSIKTGLMGPLAGIGDTIDWSTLFPLYTILVLPLAEAGSPLGAILQFTLLTATLLIEGTIFSRTGFRFGARAATNILQDGRINTFISCASVMGLFMMGGLSATMVKVSTPMWIPTIGDPMYVQTGIFDKVAPGLLALGTVLFTYYGLMKGNSMAKMTLVLLAIGIVTGAIGVLGLGGFLIKGYGPQI